MESMTQGGKAAENGGGEPEGVASGPEPRLAAAHGPALAAADKRHLWHPFTPMRDWCVDGHEPVVLVRGEGAWLWDQQGRRYLDGNASIWTNIHGHNHPRINAAIEAQLRLVSHVSFLGTSNEPAIRLAQRLVALFPPDTLTRVFYSDDGSTAIEAAVRMALQYCQQTGAESRQRLLVFERGYHGDTLGAASLGGIGAFRGPAARFGFAVERVGGMDQVRSLPDQVVGELAAAVIEPLVQGPAGMRPWPAGMLRELSDWCRDHGVLLILDEVMTGFGRTGRMFACEHEGVVPDFIALAKGLTGGYMPLAATLTTETVFEAFLGDVAEMKTFYYGHSYCGNALGCAAALANLEVFEEERTLEWLPAKIDRMSERLRRLEDHPRVAEVRQCGMIAAVEVCRRRRPREPWPWEQQMGARVCLAARRHGLLTRAIGNDIVLLPPLCVSEGEIDHMFKALERAMDEVLADTCPAQPQVLSRC